jgi:NitT/TauT family transport system ATP-binding protein
LELKVRNLHVTFPGDGKSVEALRSLTFTLRDREFLGVVGPSGCGKTTLMRVLAGLTLPREGEIEHDLHPLGHKPRTLLVFQEDGLFPWMTVLENAVFGMEMQGVGKVERERRAKELLERYGVGGRENAYPHELSVGMKQRVAVIRSFLSEPDLLLMDEPFAALDAQTRMTLQQELLALWEQSHRSVIFVTHDVDEAILLCDRILVMSSQPGTIVAEVPVPFSRPRTPATTLDDEFLALKASLFRKLGFTIDHQSTRPRNFAETGGNR